MLRKLVFCLILFSSYSLEAKELTEVFGLKLGTNISELKYQKYDEILKLAEGYKPPKPLEGIDDYSLQLSGNRVVAVNGYKKFASREICELKMNQTNKKYETQYNVMSDIGKSKYFTTSNLLIGNGGSITLKCSNRGVFSISALRIAFLPKIQGAFGLKFSDYINEKEGYFIKNQLFKLSKAPMPKYGLTDYSVVLSNEKRIVTIFGSLSVSSLEECINKQKNIIQQLEEEWKVILTGSGTSIGLMNREQGFNISCQKNTDKIILLLAFMII